MLHRSLYMLLALVILLSACAPSAPVPTPIAISISTPVPTPVPEPTIEEIDPISPPAPTPAGQGALRLRRADRAGRGGAQIADECMMRESCSKHQALRSKYPLNPDNHNKETTNAIIDPLTAAIACLWR